MVPFLTFRGIEEQDCTQYGEDGRVEQHGHSEKAMNIDGIGADGMGVDPEALAEITRTVQVEMSQQVQAFM